MPWTWFDAERFTKAAKTERQKKLWAKIANKKLAEGATDASAIRQANFVVKKKPRPT